MTGVCKQTDFSARVVETRLDDLDRIDALRPRRRAWVIARLLQQASARELEYIERVEPALEDVAAGRLIPHEEVMADIKARLAARKAARCAFTGRRMRATICSGRSEEHTSELQSLMRI